MQMTQKAFVAALCRQVNGLCVWGRVCYVQSHVSRRINKEPHMIDTQRFLLGGSDGAGVYQLAAMGNRHGLVTGATGTGKTITLQVLAESFSAMGVPVFAADIKGDLSGNRRVRQAASEDRRASGADAGRRVFLPGQPRGFLGRLRPHRASAADQRLGDGAPIALEPHGAQRNPDGHHVRLFPHRRRAGTFAPRPQGPAGHAGLHVRERLGTARNLRQHQRGQRRCHPAADPGPGGTGR